MRIDLESSRALFREIQSRSKQGGECCRRDRPRLVDYDYIVLSGLRANVECLIRRATRGRASSAGVALDLGAGTSPYRGLLEASGYLVHTLDTTAESRADFVGEVERTGLEGEGYDLVLCTEVLEHSRQPFDGAREIFRVLKPGGRAILSVPHVWFYHPHPTDHWRFTQEGLAALCESAGLVVEAMFSRGGSIACLLQVLAFLAFGVLGRWGAPLYVLANVVAGPLDRLFPNALFCLGFACLARRPEGSSRVGRES